MGIMMCKLKGLMDKGGHYGGNERVDGKGGIMMCKLKGGWIREGIMTWK